MKELFCPFCGNPMGPHEVDLDNNVIDIQCDTCWTGLQIPIQIRWDLMEVTKGEKVS